MSGIFGICKLNGNQIQISDMKIMASLLKHRGPDAAAYTLLNNNTVGLGHLGLMGAENILEPQPLFNADYSVCITCDGTIYDAQKIRARLWDLGIRLNTDSAAEMILYLYEAFGMEFTKFLNGEFAFVICDQRTRRMIAARDHIGIRPMYYKEDADELMFASEAKAILALSRVERRISNQYLAGVHVGTIPVDVCAFDGIKCLKPAHLLVIEDTKILPPTPYWNLSFTPDFTMSHYDAEIEIRQSLQRAVERRVEPGAGVLLSGGLDSTLVCAIMAQSGAHIAAYSIGFTQDSAYDESTTAKRIAEYYGVRFHALDCPMAKLSDHLLPTVFHTEMGISNPGFIARFLLSDWVRSHHTNVCLTGEGADEFFGGYAYFKLEELWRMLESEETETRVHARNLLAKFKKAEKFSKGILWDNSRSWRKADRLLRYPSFIEMRSHHAATFVQQIFNTEALGFTANDSPLKIFARDIYDPIMQSMDPFNVCRMLSIAQLSGFILPALGDRMEMAHGLECREPFLDLDLIELSSRIPPKYFLDIENLSEKDLLKRSTKSLLPEFLAGVHKHPFYSNHWRAFIQTPKGHQIFDSLLSPKAVTQTGIFNASMLKIFAAAWRTLPEESLYFKRLDAFIGFALSTQAISQMFIENRPATDLSFPITERPNYFGFKGTRSRQGSTMSSQSL